MYKTYLNKDGEIVSKTFKELGTTWTKINEYRVNYCTKDEGDFLERYGLRASIFNVANLRKLGHVYLTDYFVQVCLEHGAKDCRGRK